MSRYVNAIFDQVHQGKITPKVAYDLVRAYEAEKNGPKASDAQADIAIIGMACRFPRAETPKAFWQNIETGLDLITDLPQKRWSQGVVSSLGPCRRGGFLESIDQFDAPFFARTENAALCMDPQQRLFLMVCWELLENAGYVRVEAQKGENVVGVFVGARGNTYRVGTEHRRWTGTGAFNATVEAARYAVLGQAPNMIAAAVSDLMNLTGPALVIDTACSSSLVSVHLACQSLRAGDCTLAIAGGVDLMITPDAYLYLNEMKALSPDDICRAFDSKANGYVPGEGAGAVLLKPLRLAQQDGDTVYAVIKGSAINNDGHTVGVTTPDVQCQKQVIKNALERACINPETISFVEAHGTGTFIGDPIEIRALVEVYQSYTARKGYCALGSVKTNIGHAHSAAGIASLLKMVLALNHARIPPTLHCDEPNARFQLPSSPFYICSKAEAWPSDGLPRRGAVSSFGFGGTNCHMILEEAPRKAPNLSRQKRSAQLFSLSAQTKAALIRQVGNISAYLKAESPALEALCYTANVGRGSFEHRLAIPCATLDDVQTGLSRAAAFLNGTPGEAAGLFYDQAQCEEPAGVAFLFPGQGSQYFNMAAEVYATVPAFRQSLDHCSELLLPYLGQPLSEIVYGARGRADALNLTATTQPVVFSVCYALAKMWQAWGISPQAMAGHSVGEYVAACLAGVMSLEEACNLVAQRGALMQALPEGGGMAVVFAGFAHVKHALERFDHPRLGIAAINGPSNTVVSGSLEALETFLKELEQEGVRRTNLSVSHAFHSSLMEPMLKDFAGLVEQMTFCPPAIPIVSNVTGDFYHRFDGAYWQEHILQPVRLADSIVRLMDEDLILLEVGPGTTLASMVKRMVPSHANVLTLTTLDPHKPNWQTLARAVSQLWVKGVPIDLAAIERDRILERLVLPNYPFTLKSYWIEQPASVGLGGPEGARAKAVSDSKETFVYTRSLRLGTEPVIDAHRVHDQVIVSGAYLWELALRAIQHRFACPSITLKDVMLIAPLALQPDRDCEVKIWVADDFTFRVESHSDEGLREHARGAFCLDEKAVSLPDLDKLQPKSSLTGEKVYASLRELGLHYGPACQTILSIHLGEDAVSSELAVPETVDGAWRDYVCHPALIDGCLQGVVGLPSLLTVGRPFAPFFVREITCLEKLPPRCVGYLWLKSQTQDVIHLDALITDASGAAKVVISGLQLRALVGYSDDLLGEAPSFTEPATAAPVNPLDDKDDREISETLHCLCGLYVYRVFYELVGDKGVPLIPQVLIDQLAVESKFAPLLDLMIQMLKEDQFLQYEAGLPYLSLSKERVQPDQLAAQLVHRFPAASIYFRLIKHVLSRYVDVLTGRLTPMQVLFPDGAGGLLEELYQMPSPHYELAAQTVAETVQVVAQGRKAKVLEIGAGTGGFTKTVLKHLDLSNCAYYYTDISPVLLYQAREQFGTQNITFARLDIEKDPEVQGFFQAFDVVIASNVLHATPYLSLTLSNVYKLMSEQALLVLVETTKPSRFADLIFGITEGWWKFQDRTIRPHSPLLDHASWERALAETGFKNIKVLLPDATPLKPLSVIVGEKPGGETAAIDEWFFAPCWLHSSVRVHREAAVKKLLVFIHRSRRHLDIARRLEIEGYEIIQVFSGREFDRPNRREFVLNPEVQADYEKLATAIVEEGNEIEGILHLWCCEEQNDALERFSDFIHSQYVGVYSLLFLVQALEKAQGKLDGFIKAVTTNVHAVTQREPYLAPEKAPLLGLIKTLPLEYSGLSCTLLDLDCQDYAAGLVGDQLLIELISGGDAAVAYRGGQRFVQRIRPVTLSRAPSKEIRFKPGGVYVIAGGTGGLGIEVARYIAEQCPANIALISRSSFPERGAWDRMVNERGQGHELAHIIHIIREIEAQGCRVLILQGDVGHPDQMETCVQAIRQRLGKINGVINAAGVLQDGLIKNLTSETFAAVLRPKMLGSWVLDHVTRGEDLDFFILFSGFITYLGNVGQSNHCAANAFQDAFAHYRQLVKNRKTMVINWGVWSETGVVAKPEIINAMKDKGLGGIPTCQGLQAFKRALGAGLTQIGIAPLSRELRIKHAILAGQEGPEPSGLSDESAAQVEPVARQQGTAQREPLSHSHIHKAIRNLLIAELKKLEMLQDEDLSLSASFQALGLDSISIVSFTQKIEQRFQIKLYPTLFFEYPNVLSLADFLAKQYGDHFSKLLQENAGLVKGEPFLEPLPTGQPATPSARKVTVSEGVPIPAPREVAVSKGQAQGARALVDDDVAIIGMAGRFPLAKDVEQFWANLVQGGDGVCEVSPDHWDTSAYYSSRKESGKTICKWAGLVQDIDKFDPLFFNISPREASAMDPQQRLLLQTAWEALEDAGYAGARLQSVRTGVFVGISKNDYAAKHFDPNDPYSGLGNAYAIAANRVSFFLNLTGPSVALDTLCSSALVALHHARQSILSGETDMALAAAVHFVIAPEYYVHLSQMEALSPSGKCKALDKKADGFVSGEGVGVLVLKKLSQAIQDHDNIHAVLKSTAVNHDGRSPSLSAPNPHCQAQVIKEAWTQSGIHPETLTYVEAHGTGTSLGDPIEIQGLTKAFAAFTDKKAFCAIGSVKSNIGHLDAAAGIASTIKVIMALKKRTIPKTLHFQEPNPYIDFTNAPVYVADKSTPWESEHGPLRAGVSAFGMGGTNAHVVLEQAPGKTSLANPHERGAHILTLSAHTRPSLDRAVQKLWDYCRANTHQDLANIGHTLNTGRKHFAHRLAIVADDLERVVDKLNYWAGQDLASAFPNDSRISYGLVNAEQEEELEEKWAKVLMFFPDHSDLEAFLAAGTGRAYYQMEKTFREAVEACENPQIDAYFAEGWVDFPDQALLAFALQYAFARLWISWGIVPGGVAGEGTGQWVAAAIKKAISPREALANVAQRRAIKADAGDRFYDLSGLKQEPEICIVVGPETAQPSLTLGRDQQESYLVLATLFPPDRQQTSLLLALSQLYVRGFPIDWAGFDRSYTRQKLSLPTYSFEERRCWLESPAKPPIHAGEPVTKKEEANRGEFFGVVWREHEIKAHEGSSLDGLWLVFEDELGVTRELTKTLSQAVVVKPGLAFRRHSAQSYEINPHNEKDYVTLLAEIGQQGTPLAGVIHLWTCTPWKDNLESLQTLEQSLFHGLYSLFFLIKASLPVKATARWIIVSTYAQSIPGGQLAPEKSGLSILARVVTSEENRIQTTALDFGLESYTPGDIAQHILHEIKAQPMAPEAAYRHGKRLVRTLRPLDLKKTKDPVWKREGTYLITGGTSGIGAQVARFIAQEVGANLVIVGRTQLPSREEWHSVASDKVRFLLELEASGARVEYIAADISDPAQVEQAFETAHSLLGSITGVIHCAGVLEDAALANKSLASFKRVLEPKIKGAYLLQRQAQEKNVDFLVLFSSIASIYGTPGQSDYACANAFMDSLAHSRTADPDRKCKSISWSLWERGSMKPHPRAWDKMRADGIESLTTQDGIDALSKVLACELLEHCAVIKVKRQDAFLRRLDPLVYGQRDSACETKPTGAATVERKDHGLLVENTAQQLRNLFADLLSLGPEEIDPDVRLENYGVDSLAIKNAMAALEAYYEDVMDPSLFMLYPTIRSLAPYLVDQFGAGPAKKDQAASVAYSVTSVAALTPGDGQEPQNEQERTVLPTVTGRERVLEEIFKAVYLRHSSVETAKEDLLAHLGWKKV